MNSTDSMENYYLVNQIGEGSFGRVYKARRKYTGRLVAIKMINKLGQSKDDLISFRREIDLLKKVSHSNIMRMLSVFETDTDFCVVSELARGDLFRVIDDEQTLPEKVLRNVAAQLVSSLAHLHSLHIIHRDMKPQNILIAEHGALKICDFGFARALSNTTLVLTSIKGTPLYMAPELVQEQPYDEKVDVWALGVILYELYYGKPPFFTNSIYKLIQMIVNSPITWPGQISDQFKSFLLEMLQKDPIKRISCQDLLSHPFIAGVDLSRFDDRVYRFKSEQFEKAIKVSLCGGLNQTFKPKKSKILDYQMIFFNPSSHTDEELVLAVKYLREKNVPGDSPLAASFSFHFNAFISRPGVIDEALYTAAYLLRKDIERFSAPFAQGVTILGTEMSLSSIEFFTELLSIPFSMNIIQNNQFQLGDLQLDKPKCEKLRDKLLSFIFESDPKIVAQTYTLLSFFVQMSDIFLTVITGSFAPQLIPILTTAIIQQKNNVIRTAAFCILSKIIETDHQSIHYIQPFKNFLNAFNSIIMKEITSITDLSLFSSVVSFIAICLDQLTQVPEFQAQYSVRSSLSNLNEFVIMMFKGKTNFNARLKALLMNGSMPPQEQEDYLSIMSVLSSPFCHAPIDESQIDLCVANINQLIPLHQPALLSTILSLDPSRVIPYLPMLVSLYPLPQCASLLSDYILKALSTQNKRSVELVVSLCEAGILTMISSVICDLGPSVPPNVVIVLAQIIMTFDKPYQLLFEQATEILNSIFSIDSAAESGLIIASHLARMSKDFLPALTECGAMNLAERALQAEVAQIRARALDFVGNVCRHTGLPDDYLQVFVPLLMDNLKEKDVNCQKLAAFAIGNIVFWTPNASELIIGDADSIRLLLDSNDPKVVDNAAGVLGNMVRRSDKYLKELIGNGSLEALLRTVANNEELHGKTILPLASFCQYEEARSFLKLKKAQTIIAKYTSSSNERIQRYAKNIINSIS
ncbi:serine/threonine protein kinase [Tritrichomonas musculus]|uniref:non-specific serine/threonine protein kinase n=1 Tax=Tritrichomonas musculus TaxID=1915356 RepID=A0ABR2JD56_9EUKA